MCQAAVRIMRQVNHRHDRSPNPLLMTTERQVAAMCSPNLSCDSGYRDWCLLWLTSVPPNKQAWQFPPHSTLLYTTVSKTVQFHPCSPTMTLNHSNLTGRHTLPPHLEEQIHLTKKYSLGKQSRFMCDDIPLWYTNYKRKNEGSQSQQHPYSVLMYTVHVSALAKSRHQAL